MSQVPTGRPRAAAMLNKVLEITLVSWIINFFSTTVGETGADYFAVHVGLGLFLTNGLMLAPRLRAGTVRTFWITYVLTRPLGASLETS